MTTINLPSVQPAAKPAAGKQPTAGSGSEDNGSFQDVLAAQASKAKQANDAKSDTGEAARGSHTGKADAKADSQPADEQAQAQEDAKDATGKEVTAEQALPLLAGLADAGAALAGKAAGRGEGTDAAVPPRRADTSQPAPLASAEAGLGERGSKDAGPAISATAPRKAVPVRHEDPKAIEAPADGSQPAATPVASDKTAGAREAATAPDFAKLLAAREAPAPAPAVPPAAMQAAALQANANAADVAHVIEPRLGSRDWGQAVSQKVVWMVGAMEQSATLTLNPPDLGPLQVVIQVHNDQADAAFMSDNPDVRQALQDSLGTLRNMMSGAGIQLGDASISAGGRGQEQTQQQFQQAQRQTADGRPTDGTRSMRLETPVTRHGGGSGLVDTFA